MRSKYSDFFGWIDDPRGVEYAMGDLPHPVFSSVHDQIKGSGKGKIVLLYDIIRRVAGEFPYRKQQIGDCVAFGAAGAVDAIKCVDIYLKKENELWINETSTEDIYWGSRNIIGQGRLGNGDGSLGVWAAKYISQYGCLPRGVYGSIDLSKYSGERAREWGNKGFRLPKDFVDTAKSHPVGIISQVKTYEEVRDLIANGYAVTIASSQGFSSKRDSDGFAKRYGTWQHQMWLCGVDDAYKRPGVCCANSWGQWNSGPKRHDQPEGTFWIDADILERYILKIGDCWAISGYDGFKPQKINTRII